MVIACLSSLKHFIRALQGYVSLLDTRMISLSILSKVAQLSANRARVGSRFSMVDFVHNAELRFEVINEVLSEGDQESVGLVIQLMSVFLDLYQVTEHQDYFELSI